MRELVKDELKSLRFAECRVSARDLALELVHVEGHVLHCS